MVITSATYLPSDEELTVPEVNLSTPFLKAGSFHMGKLCEEYNNVSLFTVSMFSNLYFRSDVASFL